jgi:hypothetical protein
LRANNRAQYVSAADEKRGGGVSSPSAEVLAAIALAAACGTVLLASLVVIALIMRQISRRLAALNEALRAVGEITDPLTDRVTGIAANVRNLREAATALSQLVSSRSEAADVRN